jgi:WD40 repeat protein
MSIKHLRFLSIFFIPVQLVSTESALQKWLVYQTVHADTSYKFCHGAFSKDYEKLAASCTDGKVRVIDVADGTIEKYLETTPPGTVMKSEYPIVFSPDNTIIVADYKHSFNAFLPDSTTITKDLEQTLLRPDDEAQYQVDLLALTQDGSLLATVRVVDRTITLWDTQTWEPVKIDDENRKYETYDIAFIADSKRLVESLNISRRPIFEIKVWDCETAQELQSIEVPLSTGISCHPKDQIIALSNSDGTVKMWDLRAQKYCAEFNVLGQNDTDHWLDSIIYSPDGNDLLLGLMSKSVNNKHYRIKECSLRMHDQSRLIHVSDSYIKSLAYAGDDHLVALSDTTIQFIAPADQLAECL